MKFTRKNTCPVCGSGNTDHVMDIPDVPCHCNLLWESRDDAVNAPKGDIHLEFCETCGHMYNRAFDPNQMRYAENYENALHFSGYFQTYAKDLAEGLIAGHDLRGKNIIDIGCGDGKFLKLICELGGNRGVGFDPAISSSLIDIPATDRVLFIKDVYSEKYAHQAADFICCRQVLEHMAAPGAFMNALRKAIGRKPGTPVFFEVPNSDFILKELSIWDIIGEHYSYFSTSSLHRLFTDHGFDVQKIENGFGEQYLCATAFPSERRPGLFRENSDGVPDIKIHVKRFPAAFKEKTEKLEKRLREMKAEGKKAVLWGAGSKGVTFLNLLHVTDEILCVVDINPRKQDMFISGTGHQIIRPDALAAHKPDAIIIMNRIYENEIKAASERMGLKAAFVFV